MIFLLHGADSFRRRQKIQELKERFMAAVDSLGQSLVIIDGAQVAPAELQAKISGGSLFTKKRMLILENSFGNKNEAVFSALLSLCTKNAGAEDNAIVFNEGEILPSKIKAEAKKLYAWLLKQPYVQEFKVLNNNQTLDFAKKEIAAQDAKIAPSALSLLVARTGNDLWRLDNEIKKLSAAASGAIIDNALVQELVKGEIEDNIFALSDALGTKNCNLSLQLLEEQFAAGLSADYLLAMFQRQFKIMLQIKIIKEEENLSETQIATKLKLHPFVVKKGLQQSLKFSITELERHLGLLMSLDFKNKQGRVDLKSELYAFTAALTEKM
jgi:DNA polymerase-3 subunit delta